MSKLSKRLESLALLVDKKDSIVDVGCDHGLLSIYLVENKLCKKVIASDVNQNALNSAIKNISLRKLDIETVLSDGIEQVNLKEINTLIISGIGTSTILHILSDDNKLKKINKLILQSNNDHELLRSELEAEKEKMKQELLEQLRKEALAEANASNELSEEEMKKEENVEENSTEGE